VHAIEVLAGHPCLLDILVDVITFKLLDCVGAVKINSLGVFLEKIFLVRNRAGVARREMIFL